jgi:hypothetical protein
LLAAPACSLPAAMSAAPKPLQPLVSALPQLDTSTLTTALRAAALHLQVRLRFLCPSLLMYVDAWARGRAGVRSRVCVLTYGCLSLHRYAGTRCGDQRFCRGRLTRWLRRGRRWHPAGE